VPSTMMASKRVSEVFEAGASWRAMHPQASSARTIALAEMASRPRQPKRLRRTGARRGVNLRGCLRVNRSSSSIHSIAEAGSAAARVGARSNRSAQLSRRVPGGEDKVLQWFALAGREFLSEHLLVGQSCRITLIAESDNGAESKILWDFKSLAGD